MWIYSNALYKTLYFHTLNVSTLRRIHPQGHLIPIVSVLLLSSHVKLFAIEDYWLIKREFNEVDILEAASSEEWGIYSYTNQCLMNLYTSLLSGDLS
mgnify:CR=1 FL=1